MAEDAPAARRTFGPTVLVGLAASGFAAVAGHKAMLTIPAETITAAGGLSRSVEDRSVEFPLAGALALVALAAWGVLLVTRGTVRRVVAVLAVLAAAGMGAVVVVGGFVQDDGAVDELAVRLGLNAAAIEAERTGWLWVALACALVAFLAAGAAVRLVPSWPEMGSRYDAPTGGPDPAAPAAGDPSERSNLDLWKSLDEGSDPTEN
ncbi:putative membrane protein (TIGR02234 family) [Nocardioides sp. J9]|uniref:Trp biosynthesis-associated membrane protein n=1 Tax=unclassified Nocardioides TaxID=2615069 RepID=UPI0004921A27|nr:MULTISPECIES: Trp biosynthesis-associated membrane protein [unclassified Nocardioides]TWG96902.1 putative membrane protein (TIGR02234 family) [Nocardioides sp. J9]